MTQTIEEIEARDGVRLTWNAWPAQSSRAEVVPIACLYNAHQPAPELPYEPIICRSCQAVLCPQAAIDFNALAWTCLFCNTRNALPPHARDISPANLLPEMTPAHSTVEYLLTRTTPFPPVYLLIVDCCTYDAARHALLQRTLRQALAGIPADALVGLIRFGANIELMGLAADPLPTIFQFSGRCAYTAKDVAAMNIADIRNFLGPKREAEAALARFIDELEVDPFSARPGFRQMRSTGAALALAAALLEGAFADSPARHLLFTQGPCTHGPGKTATLEVAASSERLDTDAAAQFYQALAERLNAAGHAVDIVAETIADIGLEQMRPLLALTGGTVVMAQDFEEAIAAGSIERLFARRGEGAEAVLATGFNAKLQVRTSAGVEFKGVVGEGRAAGGGWRVGALLPRTNLTFVLETLPAARHGAFGYVQVVTQYQRSDRRVVTRVTTFGRMFTDDRAQMCATFDQEAACVFQARAFMAKGYRNVLDFESAIDKNLLRFIRRYGSYVKGNAESVSLPDALSYYPNFMFFFRRSLLVQREGVSPDESAYFGLLLYRLPAGDAIKMIKPTLVAFHYQGDVMPVELDMSSLNAESVLVLDSFHNVLLWRGAYVCDWMREGLHEKPEYAFFKQALADAEAYAQSLQDRLPVPQYKETEEGKSQARILLHYANPSQQGAQTEKIDYALFYKTLCQYIVRAE